MIFNQGAASEASRWILCVLLIGLFGGGFLAGGIWMIMEGTLLGLILVLMAVLWSYFVVTVFYYMAAVTLSDECVSVRVWLKTKTYSWNEIVQAGVLRRAWRYGYSFELVLLPGTSVCYNHTDKLFAYKNRYKLIHIPYTEDVVSYILAHYGPLDFNHVNE